MTVCADAIIAMNSTTDNVKISVMVPRLVMTLFPASVHHQGQHTGFSPSPFAALSRTGGGLGHQIGQRCVFEDLGSCIPHIQKYLVQGAVVGIAGDKAP